MIESKYGVARHVYIPIPKAASANHAVGADWTPSAGDVKISKDGGAAANVTNLPTAIAMGNSAIWDFSLTATEMQAAQIVVTVADSATKAVDDTGFIIETYGHASAQHAFDRGTASTAQTGDSYAAMGATAWANAKAMFDGTGYAGGTIKLGINLVQILGTTLTETAGQIAAGFKKFFNVATPGSTMDRIVLVDTVTTYTGNTPQTGDNYARIGAAGAGLTALGDTRIANLDAAVSSRSTYAGGAVASVTGAVGSVTGNVGGSVASVTADVGITQTGADKVWGSATRTLTSFGTLVADAAAAVWAAATRVLTAGTNIVLAKGTGVTGFNDLDAAGVRSAVGLGSANLDTQIADLPTNAELTTALGTADDAVLAQVALVKAKTDNLPSDPADQSLVIAATDAIVAAVGTPMQAGSAVALTAAGNNAVADAWTARNVAGGSSAGRTNGQALAVMRNKVVIAAGVITVYDTDDVSVLWTGAVTQTAGDPISAIDPT